MNGELVLLPTIVKFCWRLARTGGFEQSIHCPYPQAMVDQAEEAGYPRTCGWIRDCIRRLTSDLESVIALMQETAATPRPNGDSGTTGINMISFAYPMIGIPSLKG